MSFVSDDFVLFFLVVCIGYFAIPYRFRWGLLLGSSIFFYAYWRIDYLLLFVFVIAVNYLCALLISRTANEHKTLRRLLLGIALSASLGTLFVFKYFNFFIEPFNDLLAQFGVNNQIRILNILLPVGISFYTFQAFAYTIDVYRRTIPAERHFGIFATFIAFFPQLVAGPIERASHLLPQFRQEKKFNYAGAVNGLQIKVYPIVKTAK